MRERKKIILKRGREGKTKRERIREKERRGILCLAIRVESEPMPLSHPIFQLKSFNFQCFPKWQKIIWKKWPSNSFTQIYPCSYFVTKFLFSTEIHLHLACGRICFEICKNVFVFVSRYTQPSIFNIFVITLRSDFRTVER